jgi:hypothetical protein
MDLLFAESDGELQPCSASERIRAPGSARIRLPVPQSLACWDRTRRGGGCRRPAASRLHDARDDVGPVMEHLKIGQVGYGPA